MIIFDFSVVSVGVMSLNPYVSEKSLCLSILSCADGAVMRSWFDVPELPFKVVLLHFTLDLSNASYSMNWQIVNGLVAPS